MLVATPCWSSAFQCQQPNVGILTPDLTSSSKCTSICSAPGLYRRGGPNNSELAVVLNSFPVFVIRGSSHPFLLLTLLSSRYLSPGSLQISLSSCPQQAKHFYPYPGSDASNTQWKCGERTRDCMQELWTRSTLWLFHNLHSFSALCHSFTLGLLTVTLQAAIKEK